MALLRLDERPGTLPDHHQVALHFEADDGHPARRANVDFQFALSVQEREDIRWYLEDYLYFNDDPAPRIAMRVEALMAATGKQLFTAIFEASNEAREIWAGLHSSIADARIEVSASIAGTTTIPWELLCDPATGTRLALAARAFVHAQQEKQQATGQGPSSVMIKPGRVRVLLAICRPQGADDVSFRSVANPLFEQLSTAPNTDFAVDVLRPPTFECLKVTLRQARKHGDPYQIVHFDGHGVFDKADLLSSRGKVTSGAVSDSQARRGFIVFENPGSGSNEHFVDGVALGEMLREAEIPLLVLNACQSAFAEPPAGPQPAAAQRGREEVASYGSLAQAVVDQGVPGVVAMRYVVYVVTATTFSSELYAAVALGQTLGEAVSMARRHLADQPERQAGFRSRFLQDWFVPIVWEPAPLRLTPKFESGALRPRAGGSNSTDKSSLLLVDRDLPPPPEGGFIGQDSIFYELERAFESGNVVLLHGYAGSGKTATAAAFARWYLRTRGVDGPILFSSFEQRRPLADLFEKIEGQVPAAENGETLPGVGSAHGRESRSERQQAILRRLGKRSVLWIWDSVEQVAGFSTASLPGWTMEKQRELRNFLETARRTKAKFLLTSRRDEWRWLGDMPKRTLMMRLPFREAQAFASGIAGLAASEKSTVTDLRHLVRFTVGNPLTILTTVHQALRDGLDTREKLEGFVTRLQAGEAALDDRPSEDRAKSLRASLDYAVQAFDPKDRRLLSLLHLFQRYVRAQTIAYMGELQGDWRVETLSGVPIEQVSQLLDRAADAGLLTLPLHRRGAPNAAYVAHAALPWYFRGMFEQAFPGAEGKRVRAAFAAATSRLGYEYSLLYGRGESPSTFLNLIAFEELNLLAAFHSSLAPFQIFDLAGSLAALNVLYEHQCRRGEWQQLVKTILPHLEDAASGRSLSGREALWTQVNYYRGQLAMEERDWSLAQTLFQRCLGDYARVSDAAMPPSASLTWSQRNAKRSLSSAHLNLGKSLLEQDKAECIAEFKTALRIAQEIHESRGASLCCFNLGQAYRRLTACRDLQSAEDWIREALGSRPMADHQTKAICAAELAFIRYERFKEIREAGGSPTERERLLNEARDAATQALQGDLSDDKHAIINQYLGRIHRAGGQTREALSHYLSAIKFFDHSEDFLAAGNVRYEIAAMLCGAYRFQDARVFAEAAVENLRRLGGRHKDDLRTAEELLRDIDQLIDYVGRTTG